MQRVEGDAVVSVHEAWFGRGGREEGARVDGFGGGGKGAGAGLAGKVQSAEGDAAVQLWVGGQGGGVRVD